MRSKPAAILIIAFGILALAVAEMLYPVQKSIRVDVVRDLVALIQARSRVDAVDNNAEVVRRQIVALEDSLARTPFRPSRDAEDSLYLVVDTHTNQLFVRRGNFLLRTCAAATGSNRGLSGAGQQWFFSTPKGIMSVRDKRVDPVWIMPDWAFVEKGAEVPPPGAKERMVPGHLGEYALILGGGIMIHGTTDNRSLGRNVSHGCIRLGRDDLRYVYQMTDIGTKVYIF
jgi:L,D-transpeptidase YbiS